MGVAKHRHAVERGYARGEETRSRIIQVAIRLFGERGFAGASTRDIASHAGVNAPALQYYFDNKEGVYLACVEHIVARVWEYLSEPVSHAEQVLQGDSSDEELIDAFCGIQAQLAEFMFTSQEASDWRLFMARQQAGAGPPAGFEIVHERLSRRISNATAAIVGRLLGRPASDDETLIRTMALNGQLMVFQVARRSTLTELNWDTIDAERLELLKRVIREHTAVVLSSMLAERAPRQGGGGASRARPERRSTRRR
jgi:AcrR family transcriptional regulator